jgi:hypothetical protein
LNKLKELGFEAAQQDVECDFHFGHHRLRAVEFLLLRIDAPLIDEPGNNDTEKLGWACECVGLAGDGQGSALVEGGEGTASEDLFFDQLLALGSRRLFLGLIVGGLSLEQGPRPCRVDSSLGKTDPLPSQASRDQGTMDPIGLWLDPWSAGHPPKPGQFEVVYDDSFRLLFFGFYRSNLEIKIMNKLSE